MQSKFEPAYIEHRYFVVVYAVWLSCSTSSGNGVDTVDTGEDTGDSTP